MSIASKLVDLANLKAAIKAAIVAQSPSVPPTDAMASFPPAIASISGGGGGGGSDAPSVRFLDHDGTVLHYYTAEEAQALTEMPSLPTATGLTCQGWNYTLQQMKDCVTDGGACDVGAMYVTDDGKTHVNLTVRDPKFTTVKLILKQTVSEGVSIDWGDGSAATTWSGTSDTTSTHEYSPSAYPTSYTILITASSGSFSIYDMSLTGLRTTGGTADNHRAAISSMLDSVNIGSGVTSIGNYAFYCCYTLQSITIPSGVTLTGTHVFYSCYALRSFTLPSGCTNIDFFVFQYCYALQSITIPPSVTIIRESAFSDCYSLRSVTIPTSVTSIGYAFSRCYALQSVTIPTSVTSIGSFVNCRSLQSVTIPSGTTSLLGNMFSGCYSLQSVTIPSGVTRIGDSAFGECYSLQSVTIPSGVTSIGAYAFSYCANLQSITIPSGVTSIGANAFYYCYSLQSITIPPGVTSIGGWAFQYCYSLKSITISSGVTSIGGYAFQYCNGLLTFDFRRSESVPTLANVSAFASTPTNKEIIVPDSLYNDWKAASNWSSTTNNIVNCIVKASESSLGPLT